MNVEDKDRGCCSGCGCCMFICKFQAIEMVQDKHGFCYPEVDKEKCTDCGQCLRVCPFEKDDNVNDEEELSVYACRLRDKGTRMKSRSGGLFVSLAKQLFEEDGLVYGCTLDKDFLPEHSSAENTDELEKMQGVKYAQSDSFRVFAQIADQLVSGNKVLFSGTPCQTVALKSFLKKAKVNDTQLILVDLVCHGVPGKKIWGEFLEKQKKNYGKIVKVSFRDKKFGWHTHKESLILENGRTIISDCYARLFWKDLILRESCFNCPYHGNNRAADLTIGDYWGAEKEHEELCDETGLSLCIVRTPKGKELFDKAKSDLEWKQSITDAYKQKNLLEPTEKKKEYNQFWRDYDRKGYNYVIKKYGSNSFCDRILNKIGKLKK